VPEITLEEGYASFRPQGRSSVPEVLSALEAVGQECREKGVTRLLVDLRGLQHGPIGIGDRYQWGHSLADTWDRGIKLSFLGREDQLDRDRFGTLVAQNRGLHYGISTSEPDAIAWLLGA
jgi:hypothetical protein